MAARATLGGSAPAGWFVFGACRERLAAGRERTCVLGIAKMNRTTAIVLAAGKGTRMKSDLPKVLFPVLGRPMIHWVLDALEKAGAERPVVVVGYQADRVREELRDRDVRFALQEHQLGTGHAVQSAMPQLGADENPVFVLAGDSPLVQPSSLRRLRERMGAVPQGLLLGTLTSDRPDGLGRIVRDESGRFLGIVEHKDATEAQLQIREVNMSTYLFAADDLREALGRLGNQNQQGEYYLTDCAAILRSLGRPVEAWPELDPCESLSVNTLEELARVEDQMRQLGYRVSQGVADG